MAKVKLDLQQRKEKKAKALRREDFIPAVAYDQKTNSKDLQINLGDLEAFMKEAKKGQLVEITIDGKNPQVAVFKEIQLNVKTYTPIHVSFMILDDKTEVDMPVRIELTGEAKAVKNSIGVLIQVLNSIDLRGFPKDFPDYLELDIADLAEIGDSLDVSNLNIPDNLEFVQPDDKELTVATIRPFQKEVEVEEEKPAEGEEGEELAEGEELPEGEEESTEGETPAEDGETSTENKKSEDQSPE
jgi:large subunit ribosomal protein L25